MPYYPGPDSSLYDAVQAAKAITSSSENKSGANSGKHGGGALSQIKINQGMTKTGPLTGLYDPEMARILGAEL